MGNIGEKFLVTVIVCEPLVPYAGETEKSGELFPPIVASAPHGPYASNDIWAVSPDISMLIVDGDVNTIRPVAGTIVRLLIVHPC